MDRKKGKKKKECHKWWWLNVKKCCVNVARVIRCILEMSYMLYVVCICSRMFQTVCSWTKKVLLPHFFLHILVVVLQFLPPLPWYASVLLFVSSSHPFSLLLSFYVFREQNHHFTIQYMKFLLVLFLHFFSFLFPSLSLSLSDSDCLRGKLRRSCLQNRASVLFYSCTDMKAYILIGRLYLRFNFRKIPSSEHKNSSSSKIIFCHTKCFLVEDFLHSLWFFSRSLPLSLTFSLSSVPHFLCQWKFLSLSLSLEWVSDSFSNPFVTRVNIYSSILHSYELCLSKFMFFNEITMKLFPPGFPFFLLFVSQK